MDGGSLNLRNDEVFDKLDSAPRKDVNRLIQLQKETNANNIAKQRRDSLNAIEESLFKLDIFEEVATDYKTGKKNESNKQEHENTVFYSIVNNLSADNDSFLKKIETLYNILFKSYKSELIIRQKLGSYHGSINDADEYVKNRILGRIIFNIEYFRNFTKEYEKYDFEDVINQIKRIPESSIQKEDNSIHTDVCATLHTTITIQAVNSIIDKLKISIKYGGVQQLKSIAPNANVIQLEKASLNTHNSNVIASPQSVIKASTPNANVIGSLQPEPPLNTLKDLSDKVNKIAATLFENYANILNSFTKLSNGNFNTIEQGVKLIMHILLVVGSTKSKPGLEGGAPTKTTESNLLEYVKRAGENAILVLTKDITISKKDAEHEITNLILIQTFLSKNLDNKVNFYVLEVFYGIIYGTLLSYDLRLKEENKYIVERVENLSQVYSIINDIIYDQTYRTLKQLYNKKYPGFRNIFRIDSLYNDVFTRKETNKTEKGSFTEEKEYNLRDLVILKINNGAVDIKEFQKLLNIMYKQNKYQDLYKFLHEVANIYNLSKEIEVLKAASYDEVVKEKNTELEQQLEKVKKDLDKLKTELDNLKPELDKLKRAPELNELQTELNKLERALELNELKTTPKTLETQLNILKTKASKIIGDSKTNIDSSVNLPNGTAGTSGIENKTDNDLHKVIEAILDLDPSPEDSTQTKDKFSGLFSKYIDKTKKMGGAIESINIETPVSGYDEPILNVKKCDSLKVDPMIRITEKLGGNFEEDYEKIKIKKEELKAKLENPTVDDDITESVTDNAKRKLNKVKNSIKQFFNTKENVEEDIPKVLDEEYLDELKKFNINSVKTQSYKELRKNLYRIKNNEYFEDIKITNEDIYTFIATTYVLRVISLYITMWFIQIEIVKDVESVIVSYILTYILLFILIYTFVNLSDNQLDTSKSFLYYFYTRVNFSYTRFIVHLGLLLLLIIIPFVIRTIDKESSSYKHISDIEKRYLYTFITNMSTIVWVILSIIAFFFK